MKTHALALSELALFASSPLCARLVGGAHRRSSDQSKHCLTDGATHTGIL